MSCKTCKTWQPIKDSDAGWEKINLQNFAEVEKAPEFSGRWTQRPRFVTIARRFIYGDGVCGNTNDPVCTGRRVKELHLANPLQKRSPLGPRSVASQWCESQWHSISDFWPNVPTRDPKLDPSDGWLFLRKHIYVTINIACCIAIVSLVIQYQYHLRVCGCLDLYRGMCI